MDPLLFLARRQYALLQSTQTHKNILARLFIFQNAKYVCSLIFSCSYFCVSNIQDVIKWDHKKKYLICNSISLEIRFFQYWTEATTLLSFPFPWTNIHYRNNLLLFV